MRPSTLVIEDDAVLDTFMSGIPVAGAYEHA
jgi:hypothetical protein